MHKFRPSVGSSPSFLQVHTMEDNTEGNTSSFRLWRSTQKGGFRAAFFVYALVALENMGFVANMSSMVLYFYEKMHFDLSGAANTLTNFLGSTFLLSIVGGFVSDTYLNRFRISVIFGVLEVLGLVLLTIQAHFPSLQPDACGKSSCIHGGKAAMFYVSLCLFALGGGGIRGVLSALGADQFDVRDRKQAKALASYFNWYLLSTTAGAILGVTVIVWVSSNRGWWLGFLISAISASIGYMFLVLGSPFYRTQPPADSPIITIAQVIVVAVKNGRLSLPDSPDKLYQLHDKESAELKISHSRQFRCLDKAAILPHGSEPIPWRVCSMTQVEEVKILIRMLPIIASTIFLNTCLAQLQTFSIEQGNIMDRHLGSFEVPASSIPVIPLLFLCILIPLYEFIFIPFARKITNHPSGITQLQRVGVGLVLSAISMVIAGFIEVKRRHQSLENPMKPISLFWLSFQYAIFGVADLFSLVGLMEFFYKEAPVGMRSLSNSFTSLTYSFGYFLSTIFVNVINSVTKRITPSKQGWLHGQDLDKNNLDLFYWFLGILSCLNFVNYLYWASWYKYKAEDTVVLHKSKSEIVPHSLMSPTQDDRDEITMETEDQRMASG